jgi:two-component system phosphate regulon sensor histidine kinase PhoR
MLLLSVFFTGIIILAFASSLYQLIKQKKIAAIKTDFINNMTHEFKTPIATINLALDAIKNPQIIQDRQKVMKYVGMIKDENKRMNAQVENVLRISKLDKNQFEVDKSKLDLSAILQNAMSHVDLLLKDKHGEIRFHPDEKNCLISGNENHLTNAFVNILENAIKYSIDSPKIDIFIKGATNLISVQIKDCGIGMSKASQRQVFDKFYREQVGNIHNIKGHGLGLSYVKEIVKLHQGTVFVKSEKGKGSVFTIQFPRIP